MYPAIFFPTHQSKKGEIDAVGYLSPLARTRTRPTFNITKLSNDSEEPIEYHLSDLAERFSKVWGTVLPIYFDFPRYGPDAKCRDGRHPVEYFFDCIRQVRVQGIPVAGPESVRGPGFGYLDAVARIAARDGRGLALRVPYRDLSKPESLLSLVDETLAALAMKPEATDLFLDFEAIALLPPGEQSEQHLLAVATEALQALKAGTFRNVILSGSSIPEKVDKRYNWNPLRLPRTVLKVWQILAEREAKPPLFGDNGVIYAHDRDSGASGPPPSRIRLSAATEFILCRAPRGEYRKLSSDVVAGDDFNRALAAWGAVDLVGCAMGRAGEGNAAIWVARDTNLHDESTAHLVEKILRQYKRLDGVVFADPEKYPWLQSSLGISQGG